MENAEPHVTPAEEPRPRVLRRMIALPEGKVLVAGIVCLLAYLTAMGLTAVRSPDRFHSLWTMTTSHILGGRASGILWGLDHEPDLWRVLLVNMAIETFLVLLFYPLFVFSYQRLIVIEPLEDTMARVRQAARAHKRTVMKFGIPGLLLFVWFPFWMTGPLVGSIIGFLIGLPVLVNLGVVLAGTYLAIFSWAVLLRHVHERLSGVSPYIATAFVAVILLLAISVHIRYAFSKRARAQEQGDADSTGG